MTLNDLAQEIYQNAVSKGFYDDGNPPVPERLMLMVTELAEAMEEYRNHHGVTEIYYNPDSDKPDKPEGIPVELADGIIRILDFMYANGIDPDEVVRLKMDYNAGRPHMHGGKKC